MDLRQRSKVGIFWGRNILAERVLSYYFRPISAQSACNVEYFQSFDFESDPHWSKRGGKSQTSKEVDCVEKSLGTKSRDPMDFCISKIRRRFLLQDQLAGHRLIILRRQSFGLDHADTLQIRKEGGLFRPNWRGHLLQAGFTSYFVKIWRRLLVRLVSLVYY